MTTEDYLKYLRTLPEGFDDVPYPANQQGRDWLAFDAIHHRA
jgi:hypothetical protein